MSGIFPHLPFKYNKNIFLYRYTNTIKEPVMDVYSKGNNYYLVSCDEYAECPRDWDNLGTIVNCNHRRWGSVDDERSWNYMCDLFGVKSPYDFGKAKDYVVYTVSMYEHGNVYFNCSPTFEDCIGDSWDSGIFGVIYVSKERVREYYNVRYITKTIMDKVENDFKAELETYSQWVNGEVYEVFQFQFKNDVFELVDQCGGYYNMADLFMDYGISEENYYGATMNEKTLEYDVRHKDRVIKNST